MTNTPTSGAADLRATFSEMLVDLPNTEPYTLFQAGFDAALAAGRATAAQAGVPANMRLCYLCGHPADAHPWVNDPRGGKRRGDCPAAPAQPAAPQGVAYAELPDEREMLKHALWLASSFTVHRYLISNAEGRWSGAEKATCHDELCRLYVAVFRGVEVDQVRVDFEADWVSVHDATQELTDHMDVVIGFPLKGVPDYESLAPKFFAYFHRLATHALRASHGQAPAQPDQPIACSYGDNGYACCEGGPCQADVHNDKLAEQQTPATAQAADSVPAPPPPPECETEAEKRAFAFGWFKALESERMKAESVQEDAALWHWLAEYLVGTRTDLDDEIVACETVNDLRKLVKAAIKQGENHDNS